MVTADQPTSLRCPSSETYGLESSPDPELDSLFVLQSSSGDETASPQGVNSTSETNKHSEGGLEFADQGIPTLHSYSEFSKAQLADQTRLPWDWQNTPTGEPYSPQVLDKWWSRSSDELIAMRQAIRSQFSHIGRIMETEVGEMLPKGYGCTYCLDNDLECWIYSRRGRKQVKFSSEACARCRVRPKNGGCSLSIRDNKRPPRAATPPQRMLRPFPVILLAPQPSEPENGGATSLMPAQRRGSNRVPPVAALSHAGNSSLNRDIGVSKRKRIPDEKEVRSNKRALTKVD